MLIAATSLLLSSCTQISKEYSPSWITSDQELEYLMNHCEIDSIEISSSETINLKMADGGFRRMKKSLFNEIDARRGYRLQKSGCSVTTINNKK